MAAGSKTTSSSTFTSSADSSLKLDCYCFCCRCGERKHEQWQEVCQTDGKVAEEAATVPCDAFLSKDKEEIHDFGVKEVSCDSAMEEIAFDRQKWVENEDKIVEPDVECTLAIIKPEAMVFKDAIEKRIIEEGFEILQTRWLQLTAEQVSEFFEDSYGSLSFPQIVIYMSSAPIVVSVLAKKRAVRDWRFLMGPTKVSEAKLYFPESIRAKFGNTGMSSNQEEPLDFMNVVHGSQSQETAEREIHYFFPEFILEPILRNKLTEEHLWRQILPVLTKGLIQCCKLKPLDPISWLALYLIEQNPNKPKILGEKFASNLKIGKVPAC